MARFLPRARNLRTDSGFALLLFQDYLLAEIDEKLPLAGHVTGTFQEFHLIEWFLTPVFFMRPEEVVISHPERDAVVGTILGPVSAGDAVGFFKGAVQAFDDLLEGSEFFRDLIVIGEPDDLGDEDIPFLFKLELLGGKRVCTVSVSDEFQGLTGEFLEFIECHTHGEDAGTDIPGCGDLVSKYGAGHLIHDEPDIGFQAIDLDVGLIANHVVRGIVIIGVHKRSDDDSRSFGVVVDHGM